MFQPHKQLKTALLMVFFASQAYGQTITIHTQNPTVPVPDVYQPGVFLVPKTLPAANDIINNGIHFNSIRLIDIETAMNFWTVSSIDDVMAQLESQKPEILLADSRCDKLILPFMKMPPWLSSSSDTTTVSPGWAYFNAVPPANYATWNLLVDSVVGKINDQWGLDPYYEIWNEPDVDTWQGTEGEYYELFKNTYFAIKNNHPNAKVGGPTVSSFRSYFAPATSSGYLTNAQLDSTIIGAVIDSCVVWNAPLDFISWHKFGLNLYSVEMEMNYLDQKLINSGHGVVPYLVTEWNLGFSYRETPLDAAYMVNYTQAMKEHNIDGHMVAAWQDFQEDVTEFHGDYGLLSWGALHKPSWKGLRLLERLDGELVTTSPTDYRNLNTMASYQNDTLKVLVSNYSLPGTVEASFSLFYDHQISLAELDNNGYTPGKLDSVYQGLIVLSGSDSLTLAINSVIPTYQAAENALYNGRDIDILIPGLTGTHDGFITIIDSIQNNVIHAYDSLLFEGYSRAAAVTYLYPNDAFAFFPMSMTDSVYSFHLQGNGVALLEIYMPELTISIPEENVLEQVTVYPNPTTDVVNIQMENPEDLRMVHIFDMHGRLIKSVNSSSFSIPDLANGTYILKIELPKGSIFKKLIKE